MFWYMICFQDFADKGMNKDRKLGHFLKTIIDIWSKGHGEPDANNNNN